MWLIHLDLLGEQTAIGSLLEPAAYEGMLLDSASQRKALDIERRRILGQATELTSWCDSGLRVEVQHLMAPPC
jgi:hypothetical protein